MNRTLPLTIALALLVSSAIAESPELLKLRSSYRAAVERSTTPLRTQYISALTRMKTDFTKAGKLQEALEIDKEIQQLQTEAQATATANSTAPGFPANVCGVVWSYNTDTLKINADGTANHPLNTEPWKWEIAGERSLKFTNPSGKTATMKWNQSFTKYEGVGMGGTKIEGNKNPK